jgi:hypothetical protein
MKKLLTTTAILLFLFSFNTLIFAQEDKSFESPETQYNQSEESELDITEEDQEINDTQEKESLAERLEREREEGNLEEISMGPPISFLTILGAILIPATFIIICYLILKFFKF